MLLLIQFSIMFCMIDLSYANLLYNSDYDDIIQSPFLKNAIEVFYNYPNERMWKKRDISPFEPFIFFHQRKSGGTSIRKALYEVSIQNDFKHYILCATRNTHNIQCNSKHFPMEKGHEIYAGHFKWNYLEDFNFRRHNKFTFSCTTNFREPIARLKSCLSFRFQREIKHYTGINNSTACLQNMNLSDLHVLLSKLDLFGTSCLDEPFRILSGSYDPDYQIYDNIPYDKDDIMIAFRKTLQHITQCAPLILELPASYELVAKRFPQIANAFNHSYIRNQHLDMNECDSLSYNDEQEQLFRENTILERFLYDAVYKKVSIYINETISN